jgi:hypothetical protein
LIINSNRFIGDSEQTFGLLIDDKNEILISGFFNQNNKLDGYGRVFKPEEIHIEGYFQSGVLQGKGIKHSFMGNCYYLGEFEFGFLKRKISEGRRCCIPPLCTLLVIIR